MAANRRPREIIDSLGLCRICIYAPVFPRELVGIRDEVYKSAVCKAVSKPCCKTRDNIFQCDHFKEAKPRSAFNTMTNLVTALFIAIKENNWKKFREAVNYELQS